MRMWPNDVPVRIGTGIWLGTHVVILPGTVLGRNVVVGAGAVVRGIFPDHCVIAGVPARIVRRYVPGSGWISGAGGWDVGAASGVGGPEADGVPLVGASELAPVRYMDPPENGAVPDPPIP